MVRAAVRAMLRELIEAEAAAVVGDEVSLGGGGGPLPTEWASCGAAGAFSVRQALP